MARVINLGNFDCALGSQVGDGLTGLSLIGLSIQANFAYTSGGTTAKFYLQTSLDQGDTWLDILCFAFTTADAIKAAGIDDAKANVFTPTDGTLTDDTFLTGIFGDRLRGKLVVVGTYVSTTLYVRATVR